MAQVITLTMNPAVDKSSAADHVAADVKIRCDPPKFDPGGGGINVARVVSRLKGDVLAIYPTGGPMGGMLKTLVAGEGIAQHTIDVQNQTRTNLTVYERTSEQIFRFGMPGASLTEGEWQACLEAIKQYKPDYVVGSGSLPEGVPDDFYARLSKVASEIGARYILDTSGDALRDGMGEGVYLIKPNMRELRQLVGGDVNDEDEQEAAAKQLIRNGKAEVVVVSLGAAGSLLVMDDTCTRIRAPMVPIRSTVGAGDSMVGGIVTGLTRGWSVEKAVRYGVAAGAATVKSHGTALCDPVDVESLFERISNNET